MHPRHQDNRTERLPPLAWLRAFEAAGRHESFRAAASELHITPSAISHHIRSLEARLARPLFQRMGNRVCLTVEGRAYLDRLSAGFAELAAAADVFARDDLPKRLTIGTFPFLASEVLLPHLAELKAQLPEVSLSVTSDTALELLTHADPTRRVDAIVRYGDGRFPACRARKLTEVLLIPVAAKNDFREQQRIVSGPRIKVAGPFDGWTHWSSATGVRLDPDAETLSFDSYLTAMRATEQGLGIGLGIRPFIDSWLREGRVHIALDRPAAAGEASYLVTAQHASRPELDLLAGWLLALFNRDPEASPAP